MNIITCELYCQSDKAIRTHVIILCAKSKKDFTQYQLLTPQKDQSLPAFMIQKIISGADHTHSGVLGSGSSECRFDPCYPHHKKMRFQHPGQGGWDLILMKE